MQKLLGYLSFHGRANRARYWLTTFAIFGIIIAWALLAVSAMALLSVLAIVLFPVFFLMLYANLANAARRLHDRGKSAWWVLLFAVLPMLLSLPAELVKDSADPDPQALAAILALLGLPFSIWGFVEMGCLRGTVGANRFGDDPLAPKPTEAEVPAS